jgi:hypothetical protein
LQKLPNTIAIDALQRQFDEKFGLQSVFIQVCIYNIMIILFKLLINLISFVQPISYKYGSEPINDTSESALNQNDPVRKVYFYEKQTPMEAQLGERTALVCN